MQTYHGLGVSEGVSIGKALKIHSAFVNYPRIELSDDQDIPQELERLDQALQLTEAQLKELETQSHDLSEEFQGIFAGYRLFLKDKQFIPAIQGKITHNKINAEWALIRVIANLEQKFKALPDPYIRARFDDIRQLGERLMKNLQQNKFLDLSRLKDPVILVCHDLSPADAFHLNKENILGIVTELGGTTSHSSILARAMNIPAVVGVQAATQRILDDNILILDGNAGEVIDQPSEEMIEEKLNKQERFSFYQNELDKLINVDCRLADDPLVDLAANLDFLEELSLIQKLKIPSIGLVRTEFLFFLKDRLPDEEEQMRLFSKILQETDCSPVTIRTWDIGADKSYGLFKDLEKESNPALGLRAIRICLQEEKFFRVQLRALIQVAQQGRIRIMLPMVTRIEEITRTKELIEEEKRALGLTQVDIPLGCMVETPAMVFLIDELLDVCDFLSIGTNDLIQYALAVDRLNEHVTDLFSPYHPAVLKMLMQIVTQANRRNKPLSICGELASDPIMQMFLLGVGEITFSMSPNMILKTKKILSKVNSIDCKKIAFQFINKHSLDEAESFALQLRNRYTDTEQ